MTYLIDTNVLLRFADRVHPIHPQIRAVVKKLLADGHILQVTSQNFIEFWNVATRPLSRNGLGLSLTEANRMLRLLERVFPLIPDAPSVYSEWRNLVVTYGVSGVQVHDARLVAFMNVNGLTHILTYNIVDFSRYAPIGIVAVDPATI